MDISGMSLCLVQSCLLCLCVWIEFMLVLSASRALFNVCRYDYQGCLMLSTGPFIDKFVSGQWVSTYNYTWQSVGLIVGSSMVAVMVNFSSYLCLGRFSAVTFQVMGHTKTFMVLTGGFLFFNEVMNLKQLCGMAAAIGGKIMIMLSWCGRLKLW